VNRREWFFHVRNDISHYATAEEAHVSSYWNWNGPVQQSTWMHMQLSADLSDKPMKLDAALI
jgi:hypothetical protein